MMLHSKTIMSSEGVPRLGIQDIKYADGPFGVREELGDGFRPLGWQLDSATYFPTGSALAATWDPSLAYDYGHGIGVEARRRGKDVMLGPAINSQRLPVGGRSYEYLSEDPALAAALAVGYVKGMQDAGTAACVKHFAINNQETNRGSVNVIIDERVMREIYLKPFEATVREAGAMAIMPAYNKVNGDYCSENEHLLNEILRGEWGFKGITVSDWGATHSTMGAALHGLDVQMTGDNYLGPPLIDSIAAGKVSEKVVDDKVRELLRVRFAIEPIPADKSNLVQTSQPESRQAALEVARRSIVLLSNKGATLPIAKSVKTIAVIGQNAVLSTAAGGVGAGVKTPYEVTPLQGIQRRAGDAVKVLYAPGYRNFGGRVRPGQEPRPLQAMAIDEEPDADLLAEAVEIAKAADLVLFFCGTNKTIETEGSDRQNIKLPTGQEEVAAALRAVNPNLVSVIISGGPCDLQELVKSSPAIVQGWWNGIEGGTALAEVLFGDIAPSGKLPFTFPVKLEDSPAYAMGNFPNADPTAGDLFTEQYRRDITGGQQRDRRANRPSPESKYTEGLLVGYRWYDTKDVKPMYAFGHGLSYVDFEYAGLKTDKSSYKAKDVIKVSFDLKNTGSMAADEVAQVYVRRIGAKVEWPLKELKAFQRVSLDAGATSRVTLEIPVSNLRYWNVDVNDWTLEDSDIEILVGAASDDIRLSTQVHI
jgi:beta-glucosidase